MTEKQDLNRIKLDNIKFITLPCIHTYTCMLLAGPIQSFPLSRCLRVARHVIRDREGIAGLEGITLMCHLNFSRFLFQLRCRLH